VRGYWFVLAHLIPTRRATNPSPGPRRLVKMPDVVHPLPKGEGKELIAMHDVSDITDSVLRLSSLRRKSRHSREACPPRRRGSGNPARSGDMDPRFRGGDEGLTFISMGGPQAHDHSE
jgi:hypothetical protein